MPGRGTPKTLAPAPSTSASRTTRSTRTERRERALGRRFAAVGVDPLEPRLGAEPGALALGVAARGDPDPLARGRLGELAPEEAPDLPVADGAPPPRPP